MDWQKFREFRAEKKRPFVMSHRGASALFPENTLSAFLCAVDDGTDVLETDLRFTKDEEIILIHDETLDRTITGTGLVREQTLAEIQQYPVKPLLGESQTQESAPTLRALIEATAGKIPLALELKDPLFLEPEYGEKLVNLLREYEMLEESVIISFNLDRLLAVKALYPRLAAGWITMSNLSPNHPVEFVAPFWPIIFLNPFYISWARKLGKIVAPLDPVSDSRLGLYLRFNLDILITENPARTLALIAKKQGSG